jgi:hypothetical protein
MSKLCKYCGKEISNGSPGPHYHHNKECGDKYREEKNIELQKLKSNREIVKCAICGFEAKGLIRHLSDKHNISTLEYKEKYNQPTISIAASKRWSNFWKEKNAGENNPAFGTKPWNTDENRKEEIVEKLGKSWRGKRFSQNHKQKLADAKTGITGEEANAYGPHNVSKVGRLRMREGAFNAKQSINKHSKGEIELGIYLYEMFSDTIWDFSLDFYQCDYCIPSKNIIVEYDGDWYHSGTHYGTAKSAMQKHIFDNDKKKTDFILSKNYKLLRILESDFQKHKQIGDIRKWLSTLLA